MSAPVEAPDAFAPPPGKGRPDLLLVAGEHSGDEHAALMVRELRERHPGLSVACLGGPELEAAGAQLLYDLTEVAIVGFAEVVRHLAFFRGLMQVTEDWIAEWRPRHICLIDYPGFNLRLADRLAKAGLSVKGGGDIGVAFYVSPQIWAWKSKRRFTMARLLDRLGVIFPFEIDCYADTDLPVEFVGHPFVREGYKLPFRHDPEAPVLLLPGSRRVAVGRIFPVLLRSFGLAREREPGLRARVVYPSEGIREVLEQGLEKTPELREAIEFVSNESVALPASAVLMSSGTMSLAVGLSGIPGAIVYRLNPLSYWIGRVLVRGIEYIGIANILLDRHLYREYLQYGARPEILAEELLAAHGSASRARAAQHGADELRALLTAGPGISAATWLARGMGLEPLMDANGRA